MKVVWEYDLPTSGSSKDGLYECPVFIKNDHIYFISELNHKCHLHIIDVDSGVGRVEDIPVRKSRIPSEFFFMEHKERLFLYTDDIYIYEHSSLEKCMDLRQYGSVEAHVLYDNKLILLCHSSGFNMLLCYDLDDHLLKWKIDISNEKPYHARELCLFENKIACYGQDRLLFIDIENGDIVDAIQILRIDKLFHPIRLDEENILIGYTNWTNAGILRYNINSKQVIWRNKRKFQGPQLKCKIYQHRDTVMWVKNDTELICLNMDSGEESYHLRTSPWLYTDLQFINDSILFGTSGSDGFLNCVDAKNGMEKWSIFLKNGCTCYDIYNRSILVGDFDKSIKQISIENGGILDHCQVDGEVVGDMKIYKDCAYTVIWGNSVKPVRLIKIKLTEGT